MKKLFLMMSCIALVAVLSSCSKSKICECTATVSVMGITTSDSILGEIEKGRCEDMPGVAELQSSLSVLGNVTLECHKR